MHGMPAQHAPVMQSYQNLAARTDASSVLYPPELPQPVTKPGPLTVPVSDLVNQSVAAVSPSAGESPGEDTMPADDAEPSGNTVQLPNKRQKTAAAPDPTEEQLVDDDIDWHAPEMQDDNAEATLEAATVQTDDVDSGDTTQLAASKRGKSHSPRQSRAQNEKQSNCVKRDSDFKRIQHAVNEYIRAFLDPFYKAGIVNKEVAVAYDIVSLEPKTTLTARQCMYYVLSNLKMRCINHQSCAADVQACDAEGCVQSDAEP